VLGEEEAVVMAVRAYDVHGVAHVELTLGFRDRRVEMARLGAESAPTDLEVGDHVLVSSAMRVVVSVRRPPTPG
jgi:hypothetical protein